MASQGKGKFNAGHTNQVDIHLDSTMVGKALAKNPIFINAIANALLSNDDFIRKVTREVRNQLLRQARPTLNIFGKYAGGR